MKYRIKIITYKNGRQEFIPQVKKGLRWKYISWEGHIRGYAREFRTREDALQVIDLHYEGNTTKQNIEFEYIIK